ncbi:MAG: SRPBCC family protein [Candidatus Sedimenticola sp. 1PA]
MQVTMHNPFPVSADKLWETIGGFNALPDWHPGVEGSTLENGGKTRRLTLVGGGEIVEKLEKMDDAEHSYTYSIVSSPFPIANYSATISIKDDDNGGSEVTWSGNFEPNSGAETDAGKIIEGIYQTGFDNLKKMFGM